MPFLRCKSTKNILKAMKMSELYFVGLRTRMELFALISYEDDLNNFYYYN